MESILNLLYWFWAPISLLPEWLRIGLIVFIAILVIRPIILKLLPFLVNKIMKFFSKMLYWLSYPIMKLISSIQTTRRAKGIENTPLWIDFIEGFFTILEIFFSKVIALTEKQPKNLMKIKKAVRMTALIVAILVSLAITKNPEEWYAVKWKESENWINQEKMIKELDFNRDEVLATLQSNFENTTTASNSTELTLTDEFKAGGRIREAPSINSQPIGEISMNETVIFLEEEQVGENNIRWLKVRTDDGVEGWISSRIVEEK
ncbi:SH3 domain-containing protein [Rossellomorea aquimaris]|uniref:SH3 domain-containing protein n=1 Tax=Rossellomorea aquimaris TaxID=189382 RepID=UPI001CD7EB78|nr:SH3 domain-containing protein [Rossellomorea aquimaris]MCA1060827.1 SH3 domain-containing protein [Rossellomorea aquimaris]